MSILSKSNLLSSVLILVSFSVLTAVSGFGQVYTKPTSTPQPYLQPLTINTPQPAATPLIKKTASSASTTAAPDIVNPATASTISIPGYTGILVETVDGKILKESFSNYAFNPASNVKVATAFAVLKTLGPEYRFPTNIYTDGAIDIVSGELNGNLYVSGRDPYFTYEHAIFIANALNQMGIRQVNGDLIVANSFVMALSGSFQRSAENLYNTLGFSKRSSTATRAWQEFVTNSGKFGQYPGIPNVTFTGKVYIDIMPSNARLLMTHESAPLKEIVKVMMCYSNNFLSEKLGDVLGGAYAVARIVQTSAGVSPEEFYLQTSSGLGINRVTPRAQMKLLRAFRNELTRYKMTFGDVMPIAGIDPGTLRNRFNTFSSLGSVVAKTGTLGQTDSGVSSLTGEMQTKNGKLLFVIFNQKGSVNRFRVFQNSYVTMVQNEQGGSVPLGYGTGALAAKLAATRIVYPNARLSAN